MTDTVKHKLRLIPKAFTGMPTNNWQPTYNPFNGLRFLDYRKPLDLLKGYIDPNSWLDLKPELKSALGITDGMSEDDIKNAINKNNDGLTLKTATWANTMQYVGAAADLISNALPERDEYEGRYGSLSQGIDKGWSAASDVVSLLGPAGAVVGGFMKGASALNKGLNALGLSTDGLSKTDAVLSSDLLGWTPIGIINSAGAKESDTITKDTLAFAQAGNSYTGTSARVDDAESREGKYGLFSHNALNRANKIIGEAKEQLSKVLDITNRARRHMLVSSNMSTTNSTARNLRIRGGYNLARTRVGRDGMSIPKETISRILSAAEGASIPMFENDLNLPSTLFAGFDVIELPKTIARRLSKKLGSTESLTDIFGDSLKRMNMMNLSLDNSNIGEMPDWAKLFAKVFLFILSQSNDGLQKATENELPKDELTQQNGKKASERYGGQIIKNVALKFDNGGEIPEEDLSWIEDVPMIEIEGYDDMSDDQKKWAVLDAVKNMKNPPRWVQRLNEPARGIWFIENGVLQRGSHLISDDPFEVGDDCLFAIVFPQIQEIDGKLTFIEDKREAMDRALATGNYIKFPKDELAILLGEHYKEAWPEVFPNYEPQMENTVFDVAEDIAPYIDPRFLREIGIDDVSLLHVLQGDNAYTDGNTIYITADGDLYELLAHELTHWLYDLGKINADPYKAYWQDLDDKKLADMGADLEFVKRTGDINDFYSTVELLARINAARGMSGEEGILNEWLPTFFGLVRDVDENMYGDNFRDLLHMFNDETLSEIFKKVPIVLFLHGGKTNVIPDGALHKERHGMEKLEGLEDVTRKGIPVVSEEEGGEMVQQAEIERSELILRLEVTEKIEELYKIYYDDKSSAEEKDVAAIEAGKILAEEIIYNTDDKTQNII